MTNEPVQQPRIETDEQVFESAFFRFIDRVTSFFAKIKKSILGHN